MATTVLDSYALLAYLWDDHGGERVESVLAKAALSNRHVHMTEASYMEVKSMLLRNGGPSVWQKAAEVIIGLPIEFHAVSRVLADAASELKARHDISNSTAFTAALAQERKAEIVAGDKEVAVLKAEFKILWVQAE